MRILSIVPNSAATERLFSKFGIIHTKLRNRLSIEKVRKAAVVSMDAISKFGAPRRISRKRKFGPGDEPSPSPADPFAAGLEELATTSTPTDPLDHHDEPTERTPTGTAAASDASSQADDDDDDAEAAARSFTTIARELVNDTETAAREDEHDTYSVSAAQSISSSSLLSNREAFLLCNIFDLPPPSPCPAPPIRFLLFTSTG